MYFGQTSILSGVNRNAHSYLIESDLFLFALFLCVCVKIRTRFDHCSLFSRTPSHIASIMKLSRSI